jgi:uncharacterized protein (TIGR02145 family)
MMIISHQEIMKKPFVFIFFVFSVLVNQAQEYRIAFAGAGGSIIVNTVRVDNVSTGTTLTLGGTDTLLLKANVGINPMDNEPGRSLRIFPNPMDAACFLEFESPEEGMNTIEIFDIDGKKIFGDSFHLSNALHYFQVSGLNHGEYLIKVNSAGYCCSGRLYCIGDGISSPQICHISGTKHAPAKQKSKVSHSLIPMQYNEGDQLLLTGNSGSYSTVIPIVPVKSQTMVFSFVACTDVESHDYPVIKIGGQTWMAKNLNTGLRIEGSKEQADNGIIEKYCYDDNSSNCETYGGFYQWHEIMQNMTAPGSQGICPQNWHLPTANEWDTLVAYLGGFEAGGKMKSTGTIETGTGLWNTPNTGASNTSGFSALPSGYRNRNGLFYSIGIYGAWWSSSESAPGFAWMQYISNDSDGIRNWGIYMTDAYAVRCVWNN